MGVNKGPSSKANGYVDAGINMVRTHDYHGPFDYEYYSDFWNYDSLTQSYTVNINFDPDDPQYYQWLETDRKLDSIFINGMDVFFRIGVSHPDNTSNKTPPLAAPLDPDSLNYTRFPRLCKRTVMHCNDGWANGFNKDIRYWEIWNEPGGAFWKGEAEEYYKMFMAVYDSLKSYNPALKIGTPGSVPSTTVGADTTYREGLLKYLKDNNGNMDFYSWHLYAYENPYSIKMWTDSIRSVMDNYGFTNAESIISEINYELGDAVGAISDKPKGTAYYMSSLITANQSPVDKLFWYVGLGFFDNDAGGQPAYKYSGYALKSYSLLLKNTPFQIESSGDVVVKDNWKKDTTNLMTLAGRSSDMNKVYLIISNFNSSYDAFNVSFNNLPWTSNDQIVYTKNIVKAGERFTQEDSILNGNSSMSLTISNMPGPSMVLIRLEKDNSQDSRELLNVNENFNIYPNPAKDYLILENKKGYEIEELTVYSIDGKLLEIIAVHNSVHKTHKVNCDYLEPGNYVLKINAVEGEWTYKFTVSNY